MWRLLKVCFAGFVIGAITFTTTENVGAANSSWLSHSGVKLSEVQSTSLSDDVKSCAGRMSIVQIKEEYESKTGCIFGDSLGTKLVRYRQANTQFAYAIAFATDTMYTRVQGLCESMTYCLYSQVDNTLLLQRPQGSGHALGYIKEFTRYLKRYSNYYALEYSGTIPMITANQEPVLMGSAGISANGKWAILALKDFGFVILDIKQQKYKRFAYFDSASSTSGRPFELTVSDDGRWGLVAGYIEGPYVFELTDNCGDYLEIQHGDGITRETLSCSGHLIDLRTMVVGFTSAHTPRFASSGTRLIFEVVSAQRFATVTLASEVTGSGNPFYLAFGDSFSSGEGEINDAYYINGTNSPANHCHVSSRSYPYLLQTSWDITTLNVACSGSRIQEVQQASRAFLANPQSERPSVISLGIGGNDVDFMGKLKNCIGIGTCEWATPENRLSTAHEIKRLFPKLVDSITDLKNTFSPARLFLVGYPDVINSSPSASCSVVVGTLFTHDERRYMSESIKYLNKVLRAAAHYTKTTFADIEGAYVGERLCDENESSMNSVRYGDDIAPIPLVKDLKLIGAESFHPTPRGHQLAAVRIGAELEPFWNSSTCQSCIYTESELDFPSYWQEVTPPNESFVYQMTHQFLPIEPILSITNSAFNFLPNIFAPHSLVRFELHSEVTQLGVFQAQDDGSLQGVLAIPNGLKGYHTIHAYGESRSGELLDLYQTVYLDTPSLADGDQTQNQSTTLGAVVPSTNETVLAQLTSQEQTGKKIRTLQPKKLDENSPKSNNLNSVVVWAIILLVSAALATLVLPPIISKMREKL